MLNIQKYLFCTVGPKNCVHTHIKCYKKKIFDKCTVHIFDADCTLGNTDTHFTITQIFLE